MKYLGYVISADMKDECRQLYAQGNALARRFHMCSANMKVTIFALIFRHCTLRNCGGNRQG